MVVLLASDDLMRCGKQRFREQVTLLTKHVFDQLITHVTFRNPAI
jgi:hypothetical protein